jgi:Restriction endonuclease NotI
VAITSKGFPILEIFGFHYTDVSPRAQEVRDGHLCPFLGKRCVKKGHSESGMPLGYCSVKWNVTSGAIITCPNRLYFGSYEVFRRPIMEIFGATQGVRLKPEQGGLHPDFTMDWVVVKADKHLSVVDFFGVEVQTIDITGSVYPAFDAYMMDRADWEKKIYGINWANVWKRLLPQVVAKAQVYKHLGKKLYVILQDSLLTYVLSRGELGTMPAGQGDIVFHTYEYNGQTGADGIRTLEFRTELPTTIEAVQRAFMMPAIRISKEDALRLIQDGIDAAIAFGE